MISSQYIRDHNFSNGILFCKWGICFPFRPKTAKMENIYIHIYVDIGAISCMCVGVTQKSQNVELKKVNSQVNGPLFKYSQSTEHMKPYYGSSVSSIYPFLHTLTLK